MGSTTYVAYMMDSKIDELATIAEKIVKLHENKSRLYGPSRDRHYHKNFIIGSSSAIQAMSK